MAVTAPRPDDRCDLHLHTTCSDGTYTPEQVIDLARRCGLTAVAITDHDTLAGIAPARQAAGSSLEVVPAVELTALHQGQELHLLGFFLRTDDAALLDGLRRVHDQRQERLAELVRRLRARGVSVDADEVRRLAAGNPTRRHLAELLVRTKYAATVQDAFQRYLGGSTREPVPPVGLPVREAVALVRGAGGVAVWAHPAYDCRRKALLELRALGLQGLEVEYPGYRPNRVKQLRQLAADLGLVVSGGSDCHGPWPYYQAVGARGVTRAELECIRERAG